MKSFRYVAPIDLEHAISLLESEGARVMAGGVDLVHEMKRGIREPELVVQLKNLAAIKKIRLDADRLVIGAGVTVDELESHATVMKHAPLLRLAAAEVATPQLRSMGTIAGNILQRPQCWYYRDPDTHCLRKGGTHCHAVAGDNRYHAILGGGPCHIVCPSDLAPALVALDAEVTIQNRSGSRTVPVSELFVGPRVDPHNEHILRQGELVTEIRVPVTTSRDRVAFRKARERSAWDFALASVAIRVGLEEDGTVLHGRMALGGVAPNAWDATEAIDSASGQRMTAELAEQIAAAVVEQARPLRQNGYKVSLARNLIRETLISLAE